MPRRRRRSKRSRATLTIAEYVELTVGPNVLAHHEDRHEVVDGVELWSCFASEEDRRAVWLLHRPALLALAPEDGSAPWAEERYGDGRPARGGRSGS